MENNFNDKKDLKKMSAIEWLKKNNVEIKSNVNINSTTIFDLLKKKTLLIL